MSSIDEPVIRYAVWQRTLATGSERPVTGVPTYSTPGAVQKLVDDYNAEEAGDARQWNRPVRTEFFVVEATTTFKKVS